MKKKSRYNLVLIFFLQIIWNKFFSRIKAVFMFYVLKKEKKLLKISVNESMNAKKFP